MMFEMNLQLFSGHGSFSGIGRGGGGLGKYEDTEEFGKKYAEYLFGQKDTNGKLLESMKRELDDYFDRARDLLKELRRKDLTDDEKRLEAKWSGLSDETYEVFTKGGVRYYFNIDNDDIADIRKHLKMDSIVYINRQDAYVEADSLGLFSDASQDKMGHNVSYGDNSQVGYHNMVEEKFKVKRNYENKRAAKDRAILNALVNDYRKKYKSNPTAKDFQGWTRYISNGDYDSWYDNLNTK